MAPKSSTALAALAIALAACQSENGPTGSGSDARQAPEPAATASTEPVSQGAPNKKGVTPAFPEQTRAPERLSGVEVEVTELAGGLSEPWAIVLLPDGAMLVTERTGTLRVLGADGALSQPLAGVPEVDARGQGGLLDISLAPDFAASRRIYFTFAEPRGDQSNSTALARAQLSPDRSRIDNVEVIFQQQPAWRSALHFGSNIEWTADGNLFLALGERSMPAARTLSQDLSTHLGKVVRLTPDGAPAPGNPFLGRDDARPEIWSYGHRNIQGAAFDASGKLWTIEHGPRGGDELNAPEAGKNYGWPVISYGIEYAGGQIGDGATARAGMEQPVYYWDPVIAPGDMTFYAGDLFPWRGDLLIASLNPGGLVRLEIEDGRVVGEERLIRDAGRVRDVVEAPDGSLIVITDERDGKVLRLRPRA